MLGVVSCGSPIVEKTKNWLKNLSIEMPQFFAKESVSLMPVFFIRSDEPIITPIIDAPVITADNIEEPANNPKHLSLSFTSGPNWKKNQKVRNMQTWNATYILLKIINAKIRQYSIHFFFSTILSTSKSNIGKHMKTSVY